MSTSTPHDAFFKKTFSNLKRTKNYLENYLPVAIQEIIDLDTLDLYNSSHIDKRLKEVQSDLLFTVDINGKEGYLYFLFEHKSYISPDISLQLLKYIAEIWIEAYTYVRGSRLNKLPVIIPLVFYNGENPWNIGNSSEILIKDYTILPEEVKKLTPTYEYLLYDISGYKKEDFKGMFEIQVFMKIIQAVARNQVDKIVDILIEAAKHYGKLENAIEKTEYFEIMLNYVFSTKADFTKEDLKKVLIEAEAVYPEGSDIVKSFAERLREEGMEKGIKKGIEKGMEKGMEKGELRSMKKTINMTLLNRFGVINMKVSKNLEEIEDILILENLFNKAFQVETLEEFNSILEKIVH